MINVGRIVVTPRAQKALDEAGIPVDRIVSWHKYGDDDDWMENTLPEPPHIKGQRLLDAFPIPGGTTILVITEADRKKTTLLLDDEY